DGYLDTATSEIYYNSGFSWLAGTGGSFDLETVALHELGHSLGLGHSGLPVLSVMTPVYSGIRRCLRPLDRAALCGIWGRWNK
ncbi:MAG: matrixin family metalloprotease, partial [Acidobacteriota bacterium]